MCVLIFYTNQNKKNITEHKMYVLISYTNKKNITEHKMCVLISYTNQNKKHYWTQNVCFDFLYNFCLKHFSF